MFVYVALSLQGRVPESKSISTRSQTCSLRMQFSLTWMDPRARFKTQRPRLSNMGCAEQSVRQQHLCLEKEGLLTSNSKLHIYPGVPFLSTKYSKRRIQAVTIEKGGLGPLIFPFTLRLLQ